jgi:hypothetical protein
MAKPFSQPPAPPPFITDHIREQLRLARSIGLGQAADLVAEAAREADKDEDASKPATWLRKVETKIREMK